ncbi:unnamed protein product, partial [Durusdinium trenchii]
MCFQWAAAYKKILDVPSDLGAPPGSSGIAVIEGCSGGCTGTYIMKDIESELGVPFITCAAMEKDEAKRNYSLRNHGMQIQHMFRDTGAFLDELRDFLRNSASFMTFFSTVLAMKIPALHHDPLFEAVSNAQRQVQDLRDLTTKILTNIGVLEMLLQHADDDQATQIAAARKTAAALAKDFGMSPKDLPDQLRWRFEEFGKKKPEPKVKGKKREGSQPSAAKAKAKRVAKSPLQSFARNTVLMEDNLETIDRIHVSEADFAAQLGASGTAFGSRSGGLVGGTTFAELVSFFGIGVAPWVKLADDMPRDSEGTRSGKSTRDIVEEFKLQRAVENLRLFYVVLQLAAFALATSVVVGSAANLLWDLVPPGRTAEAVISGVSVLSWLLQAGAVATVSTCPIDELDFNSFVESRPAVCICLGLGPLVSGAFRVLEFPFPRWISCLAALGMILKGCLGACGVHRCQWCLPSYCTLLEAWLLDITVASTVTEIALAEDSVMTDAWLAIHASAAVLLAVWLQCRKTKDTIRVYANSYMAMSWGSSFYACRAVDLALGHKEWEEGRHKDIAIVAAATFSAALLLPLLLVLVVGRKVLFQKLVYLLDHRRRLQLRDGAFMAMLLDSYVVEPGQPWWLSLEEIAQKSTSGSHTLAACSSLPTARLEGKSPGFVVGRVTEVAEVQRFQQVLPWPELLRRGRQKLRCLDWAAQNPEHWRPETLGEYQLSRPLQRGETIDYFVSHSWSDSPERKWRALQLVADSFYR